MLYLVLSQLMQPHPLSFFLEMCDIMGCKMVKFFLYSLFIVFLNSDC